MADDVGILMGIVLTLVLIGGFIPVRCTQVPVKPLKDEELLELVELNTITLVLLL